MTIASEIRTLAGTLDGALCHEPAIRPNLRSANHVTTAAVILLLIRKGINSANAIYAYLSGRDCRHDLETVQFLLDAYEGGDRRHCLWWRGGAGRYILLDAN